MSIDSNSSAKRLNLERATNFMRQFRDPDSRELKKLSANQFMEVWSHYDRDGNGYIEGTELDGFLKEFVSSANFTDISPDMKSLVLIAVLAALSVSNEAAVIQETSEIQEIVIRDSDLPQKSFVVDDVVYSFEDAGTRSEGNFDWVVGTINPGDEFMARLTIRIPASPIPQNHLTTFTSNFREITFVAGAEVNSSHNPTVNLVEGGPGQNFVSVMVQSVVGQDLQYVVEIWGFRI